MQPSGSEHVAPQLVSDRGRWSVPVRWTAGDQLRRALCQQGYGCTLCLDPEAREARLELWPGVSPAEFLAALDQLRGQAIPAVARPTPAGLPPVDKGTIPISAVQRT